MFLSESNYASLCTFLLQLSWGLHSQFFSFVDYPRAILVTAFTIFPIVDYLCSILVTAFAIFPFADYLPLRTSDCIRNFLICRLSLLYTCDRIRNFSYLKIISCATPPLRLCLGMLTGRIIPCIDNEYSRGLRHEMQASSATKPTV